MQRPQRAACSTCRRRPTRSRTWSAMRRSPVLQLRRAVGARAALAYDVFLEQYVTKLNIESETASSIARTLLLPAAARYQAELLSAQLPELASEISELIASFVDAIKDLEAVNLEESHPSDQDLLVHASYMHESVLPAMAEVRVVADRLEKVVADDLWPLPKYSEILFIK